jgi:heavy metal translocating P-type ATPase
MALNIQIPQICSLCQQALSSHPIIDQAERFCCHGCQAVFSILSIRGGLEGYQEHPLFLQALRSGLISNPSLLDEIRQRKSHFSDAECERLYFEVREMWCSSCAEVISLVLLQEKGIKQSRIDYATDMAFVEFSPRMISKESIFNRIRSLGYEPIHLIDREKQRVSRALYLRFAIAIFCALNAMMFAYPLYAIHFDHESSYDGRLFAWLSFFISLPVVTYTGWPILRRFWSSLCVGWMGMEALVVVGVGSAFTLSTVELFSGGTRVYFDSMNIIIAFVLLGKMIENKAKFSAKESLFRLNLSLPKRGRKLYEDGSFAFVPLKELAVGDLIEVRMGEMIVLDGLVQEGEGVCNESLMTGEPIPIAKQQGSPVAGGTFLQHGRLLVKVTTTSEESTLQHIVNTVERQIGTKSTNYRPVDPIVRRFVPFVFGIACLTMMMCWYFELKDGTKTVTETAWMRAISVLLISCPCAIGIAAPVAESALIHALAARGVIVRNRGSLRHLGRESIFIFDKTGTITQGKFTVLNGLERLSEKDKRILKAIVEKSNHPIANAIHLSLSVSVDPTICSEEFSGKGIRGVAQGAPERYYALGSAKFMRDNQIEVPEADHETIEIVTVVFFGSSEKQAIPLILGDQLKGEAQDIVQNLQGAKTALVSGDSETSVASVAKLCGFDDWLAHASPLDKQQYVESLKNQKEIVAVVGDGMNDSPALTSAHVGISVATATDVSIQVSDLLLTQDRLALIPQMRFLARKGRRIMRQNLFWAFFYNVVGIALAAFGWLSPIFAAFAMVASSLIVLFNALRLRLPTTKLPKIF